MIDDTDNDQILGGDNSIPDISNPKDIKRSKKRQNQQPGTPSSKRRTKKLPDDANPAAKITLGMDAVIEKLESTDALEDTVFFKTHRNLVPKNLVYDMENGSATSNVYVFLELKKDINYDPDDAKKEGGPEAIIPFVYADPTHSRIFRGIACTRKGELYVPTKKDSKSLFTRQKIGVGHKKNAKDCVTVIKANNIEDRPDEWIFKWTDDYFGDYYEQVKSDIGTTKKNKTAPSASQDSPAAAAPPPRKKAKKASSGCSAAKEVVKQAEEEYENLSNELTAMLEEQMMDDDISEVDDLKRSILGVCLEKHKHEAALRLVSRPSDEETDFYDAVYRVMMEKGSLEEVQNSINGIKKRFKSVDEDAYNDFCDAIYCKVGTDQKPNPDSTYKTAVALISAEIAASDMRAIEANHPKVMENFVEHVLGCGEAAIKNLMDGSANSKNDFWQAEKIEELEKQLQEAQSHNTELASKVKKYKESFEDMCKKNACLEKKAETCKSANESLRSHNECMLSKIQGAISSIESAIEPKILNGCGGGFEPDRLISYVEKVLGLLPPAKKKSAPVKNKVFSDNFSL